VPLATLGAANVKDVSAIWFRDADTGGAQPTFYLDDIRLERASSTTGAAVGQGVVYPYAPYNDGAMDPQRTGWPLSAAELAYVQKGEYTRKPGHESKKHLPEMWPVVPTAARWAGAAIGRKTCSGGWSTGSWMA
jgi:hypothetical protein